MFTRKKKTEAQISRSTLVATFGNASPPLIWKFDLERNHSFTLALQGDSENGGGDEGAWELGVTSPKGEFYPVARFATREDAGDAFDTLQQALTRHQRPLYKKILRFAVMAGLAVVGFMIATNILRSWALHTMLQNSQIAAPAALPPAPPAVSGAAKTGVPLSADDVLKAPP